MTENMKAFLDAVQNNEELGKKFNEIGKGGMEEQTSYAEEYIALAKECGITLTKDDFELDEEELSDEELKEVAGGLTPYTYSERAIDKQLEIIHKERDADKKFKEKSETTQNQN